MPIATTLRKRTSPAREHAAPSANGTVTTEPADWRDPRFSAQFPTAPA